MVVGSGNGATKPSMLSWFWRTISHNGIAKRPVP